MENLRHGRAHLERRGCETGPRRAWSAHPRFVVAVPLFVNVGDRIKVDPREARYISRA